MARKSRLSSGVLMNIDECDDLLTRLRLPASSLLAERAPALAPVAKPNASIMKLKFKVTACMGILKGMRRTGVKIEDSSHSLDKELKAKILKLPFFVRRKKMKDKVEEEGENSGNHNKQARRRKRSWDMPKLVLLSKNEQDLTIERCSLEEEMEDELYDEFKNNLKDLKKETYRRNSRHINLNERPRPNTAMAGRLSSMSGDKRKGPGVSPAGVSFTMTDSPASPSNASPRSGVRRPQTATTCCAAPPPPASRLQTSAYFDLPCADVRYATRFEDMYMRPRIRGTTKVEADNSSRMSGKAQYGRSTTQDSRGGEKKQTVRSSQMPSRKIATLRNVLQSTVKLKDCISPRDFSDGKKESNNDDDEEEIEKENADIVAQEQFLKNLDLETGMASNEKASNEKALAQVLSQSAPKMPAKLLHMTPEDYAELKSVFEKCDTQGKGTLDQEEFEEAVSLMRVSKIPDDTVHNKLTSWWYHPDRVVSAGMDFGEFALWYSIHWFSPELCVEPREAGLMQMAKKFECRRIDIESLNVRFRAYDLDNSGYIDIFEFQNIIHDILKLPKQYEIPFARLKGLFVEADRSGDGIIDFQEFITWYCQYIRPYHDLNSLHRRRPDALFTNTDEEAMENVPLNQFVLRGK